ncbi:MAG: hypothetical protein KC618_03525 [Candidatus Omnitrophica bacterium]|nr:hypothetical protein [Candidatus Omnitrophota bacterium]
MNILQVIKQFIASGFSFQYAPALRNCYSGGSTVSVRPECKAMVHGMISGITVWTLMKQR